MWLTKYYSDACLGYIRQAGQPDGAPENVQLTWRNFTGDIRSSTQYRTLANRMWFGH